MIYTLPYLDNAKRLEIYNGMYAAAIGIRTLMSVEDVLTDSVSVSVNKGPFDDRTIPLGMCKLAQLCGLPEKFRLVDMYEFNELAMHGPSGLNFMRQHNFPYWYPMGEWEPRVKLIRHVILKVLARIAVKHEPSITRYTNFTHDI